MNRAFTSRYKILSKRLWWVDYPISKEVMVQTRMHLDRKQVKKLLPILQKFVDTGDI